MDFNLPTQAIARLSRVWVGVWIVLSLCLSAPVITDVKTRASAFVNAGVVHHRILNLIRAGEGGE